MQHQCLQSVREGLSGYAIQVETSSAAPIVPKQSAPPVAPALDAAGLSVVQLVSEAFVNSWEATQQAQLSGAAHSELVFYLRTQVSSQGGLSLSSTRS